MKGLSVFLLALTISLPVAAQHRGGSAGGSRGGGSFGGSRGGGSFSGSRGSGFSGGGVSRGGGFVGGGVYRGGYGGGLRGGYGGYGGFRGGYGYGGWGYGGWGRGWRGYGYFGWPISFGFWGGYPYYDYYGGYGYGGYGYGDYGYGYAPSYAYNSYGSNSYGYAPSTSPVVVVNQQPPAAYDYQPQERTVREYRDERDDNADQNAAPYRPTLYKIAFQDRKIVSALAYWVENGQLHYVTLDHTMMQAPLSAVDRRFSEQLNRDQGVPFRLPAQN